MEVLIAASIFGMLSVIGATIFINISHSERSTELSTSMYEDARVIMENLADEIRNGTVDYEEYYSMKPVDLAIPANGGLGASYYGINRGVYASRFYDPGYYLKDDNPATFDIGKNPKNLGTDCFTADGKKAPSCQDATAVSVFNLSVDKDMGKNPYKGADQSALKLNEQDQLYLISKDGREKTIITRQKLNADDYILSVLRLNGFDKDSNGIIDIFECNSTIKDKCTDAATVPSDVKKPDDVNLIGVMIALKTSDASTWNSSSPFTPISPLRSSIKSIKFIIWPLEDPYRAFGESTVQYQPRVTIVMTLAPSQSELANFPKDMPNPEVTLQTTVSCGVMERIQTYPPTSNLSWIKDILNIQTIE